MGLYLPYCGSGTVMEERRSNHNGWHLPVARIGPRRIEPTDWHAWRLAFGGKGSGGYDIGDRTSLHVRTSDDLLLG
jgi:hypothetical protein